jgi:hypothetical protein
MSPQGFVFLPRVALRRNLFFETSKQMSPQKTIFLFEVILRRKIVP